MRPESVPLASRIPHEHVRRPSERLRAATIPPVPVGLYHPRVLRDWERFHVQRPYPWVRTARALG